MDISDVKFAKKTCEAEIKAIINMFQRQTGCEVRNISLAVDQKTNMLCGVIMDVRVN